MHEPRPLAETDHIHVYQLCGFHKVVEPALDFFGFIPVLLSGQLNSGLHFPKYDCRNKHIVSGNGTQPFHNCPMRPRLSQLRHDVRVQQETLHSNTTGVLRRSRPRGGIAISNRRGSSRSSCLTSGLAACCSRRHSSMDTSTAASTPRRVTTCGPFFRAVLSSSLNFA